MELWKINSNGFLTDKAFATNKEKKKLSELIKKSRDIAKLDRCFICKTPSNGYCNSHSIPAFCLRNIATNGKLFYSNTFIDLPIVDIEKGVNNSGTFHIICRRCDSVAFVDYENPENFEIEPTQKMLAQISMKNYLHSIYKRNLEISLFTEAEKNFEMSLFEQDYIKHEIELKNLDLVHYKKRYEKAKRLSTKEGNGDYYCFYFEKLDYKVPLAFQDCITLLTDLEGDVINNIYDMSINNVASGMHVCVFPLENSSVVMLFIDSQDKRYRKFYRQFSKLPRSSKLGIVNYIIFLYSENMFVSKEINKDILSNENLADVSRQTPVIFSYENTTDSEMLQTASHDYDLTRWNNIPNLLLEEYAL